MSGCPAWVVGACRGCVVRSWRRWPASARTTTCGEQGRDQHPSVEVLDALARALQLDEDATLHLHRLARPGPTRRSTEEREQASASIEQLIASWPTTPAIVMGRHMDVLAANRLACALSPAFAPGVNTVLAHFLDPEMRHLFRDWEDLARNTVGLL